MTWARSEQLVADMVGGRVIPERAAQLLDIDVVDPDGMTYSVKQQAAALKYGNYSLELALFNDRGDAMPGNWAKCQADVLAIVIPAHSVTFWQCSELAMYLRTRPEWNVKRLSDRLVQGNREAGRKMVDALNLLVPRNELVQLAYRQETI